MMRHRSISRRSTCVADCESLGAGSGRREVGRLGGGLRRRLGPLDVNDLGGVHFNHTIGAADADLPAFPENLALVRLAAAQVHHVGLSLGGQGGRHQNDQPDISHARHHVITD